MKTKTIILLVASAALSSSAFAAKPAPASVTLPSGVIVQAMKEGKGAKPTAADTVKVHYKGTLADGTEFDSSYARGKPATFPLGRVIPCWTQGLQQVKVGGTAKLTCPSDTAYGSRAIPGKIPANSTLYFQVELIDIVK